MYLTKCARGAVRKDAKVHAHAHAHAHVHVANMCMCASIPGRAANVEWSSRELNLIELQRRDGNELIAELDECKLALSDDSRIGSRAGDHEVDIGPKARQHEGHMGPGLVSLM